MKQRRRTYAYLNQEFKFVADSAKEAGQKTSVNVSTVLQILNGKQTCTKHGWHFSDHRLTDEERYNLPVKDNHYQAEVKDARGCYKQQEDCKYEVNCQDMRVFDFPRSREGKIDEFKSFLFSKFRDRWMIIDKRVAQLERAFIREFLDSIR